MYEYWLIEDRIGLRGMVDLWILGRPYSIPMREPVGYSSL